MSEPSKTTLLLGDCLARLKELPDNSVDAVVTDPPYGLSFMGKRWDYDVPATEVWAECLRVLKPGGHLLAFASTRTQHRMAVRIEDAGFEIRDMIAWVYGSGFPKSLDVSKAIDKMDAADMRRERQLRFCEWMRSTNITRSKATEILQSAGVISENGTMAGHFFAASIDGQPAVATRQLFEVMRPHFGCDVPAWVEQMVDERTVESENMKRREVVGQDTKARSTAGASALPTVGGNTVYQTWDITAPATEAARQWQGWGTALKPALEPITVARKPLAGTVAENVLAHGTGALNIDGCRTNPGEAVPGGGGLKGGASSRHEGWKRAAHLTNEATQPHTAGRWPANLIHDGSEEVTEQFPVANDNSAARFFYCAKASKRDRDEGLEGFALGNNMRVNGPRESEEAKHATLRANIHPTVKPTDLMRYLCRLVTPPGGVVLDPFMGSGSTGKAAALEGFQFIGIEREAEYLEIARARIAAARPEPTNDNAKFVQGCLDV